VAVEVEEAIGLLREAARGLLLRHWPIDGAPARLGEPGALAEVWRVAVAHGWSALGIDGDTQGWVAVLEETGRAACPLPLRDSAVAAMGLRAAGDRAELLDQVRAGEVVIGLALGAAAGERGAGEVQAGGERELRLSGTARFIEGVGVITHLLVAVDGELGCALLGAYQPGVSAVVAPGLAAPLHEVRLDGVAAERVGVPADAFDSMISLARLGCVARALGAAQRSFELAVEHARNRRQFGAPIGRFQAVQHRLADSAIAIDATRLLVQRAAIARDGDDSAWALRADAAAAYGAPALRRVARDAQHTLAGVGYMEEHEAPRHFRRVFADTVRFGGAPAARARLAAACLRS
jgi:alkylation response protein AidB-like acyl-CoA dehydrogenase